MVLRTEICIVEEHDAASREKSQQIEFWESDPGIHVTPLNVSFGRVILAGPGVGFNGMKAHRWLARLWGVKGIIKRVLAV